MIHHLTLVLKRWEFEQSCLNVSLEALHTKKTLELKMNVIMKPDVIQHQNCTHIFGEGKDILTTCKTATHMQSSWRWWHMHSLNNLVIRFSLTFWPCKPWHSLDSMSCHSSWLHWYCGRWEVRRWPRVSPLKIEIEFIDTTVIRWLSEKASFSAMHWCQSYLNFIFISHEKRWNSN